MCRFFTYPNPLWSLPKVSYSRWNLLEWNLHVVIRAYLNCWQSCTQVRRQATTSAADGWRTQIEYVMQFRVASYGQSKDPDHKGVLERLGLKSNQSGHLWIRLEGKEKFQEFVLPEGLWIKKMELRLYSFMRLYLRTMVNMEEKLTSFFILEN